MKLAMFFFEAFISFYLRIINEEKDNIKVIIRFKWFFLSLSIDK